MSTRFDPSLIPPAPNFHYEDKLWACGLQGVAGIDEAGRGALAGPVAAGVVVFSPSDITQADLEGLRDSKEMTPGEREKWAARIKIHALAWSVAFASHEEIDQLGIVPATRLAAQRALQSCRCEVQHLLLDYLFLPDIEIPQTNLIKGDQRSLSIAGAAVLAKTTRDALMVELDQEYPGYQLAGNKGYGTSRHLEAIRRTGPSLIHRKSFAPLKAAEKTTEGVSL